MSIFDNAKAAWQRATSTKTADVVINSVLELADGEDFTDKVKRARKVARRVHAQTGRAVVKAHSNVYEAKQNLRSHKNDLKGAKRENRRTAVQLSHIEAAASALNLADPVKPVKTAKTQPDTEDQQ